MTVTIKLNALRRGTAGEASLEMPVAGETTVHDALEYVRSRYPELPLEDGMLIVTVNDELVQPDRLLKDGDVVMLIPPIEGG